MRPNDVLNGRYRVVRSVASGGMGSVLEGYDERLRRPVAIKIVRPELVADSVLRSRFEREARTAASIQHPNVVQVFDLDVTPTGQPFLVMEWMAGESLAGRLRREGRASASVAARFTEQALRGLAAAHQLGIVHRDIKPGNLMLIGTAGGFENVKVVDFGIAQLKVGANYTRLTMTGEIIGTPAFMSPEQLEGKPVDAKTDVYAMGVVLWCLLTGRPPFGTGADVIPRVLAGAASRADAVEPSVPRALADVAERAMHKDTTVRFSSATEMAEALARVAGVDVRAAVFVGNGPASYPGVPPFGGTSTVAHSPSAAPGVPTPTAARWPRSAIIAAGIVSVAALAIVAFVLGASRSPETTAALPGGSPACMDAVAACLAAVPGSSACESYRMMATTSGMDANCRIAAANYRTAGAQMAAARAAAQAAIANANANYAAPPPIDEIARRTCFAAFACCQQVDSSDPNCQPIHDHFSVEDRAFCAAAFARYDTAARSRRVQCVIRPPN